MQYENNFRKKSYFSVKQDLVFKNVHLEGVVGGGGGVLYSGQYGIFVN